MGDDGIFSPKKAKKKTKLESTVKTWEFYQSVPSAIWENKFISGNVVLMQSIIEHVFNACFFTMTDGSASVTILWRQNESIFIVQEDRAV